MECELCGKLTNSLFLIEIEGARLYVCEECKKYGNVIKKISTNTEIQKKVVKKQPPRKVSQKENDIFEDVSLVDNYGEIIKMKREEMGLKQEEFAKLLNEKVSIIHKIENQEIEPDFKLIEKIEKLLHCKITTKIPNYTYSSKSESKNLTLGDVIKLKKK